MKDNKPKFSVTSNIIFTLKNIFRIDKVLLIAMGAKVFAMVALPFISIFMPKFIVQFFEESRPITDMLILVVVFGVVSLIIGQIKSFADGYFPRMKSLYRSMRLGSEMCLATMNVDYKYLSSELGQLECEKAQHAMSNTRTGVEDTVLRIVECSGNLIGAVLYIVVLSTLNFWIIAGLVICGVISFISGNLVNRYKLKHKDTVSRTQKKEYYYSSASQNIKYAKDVRMYGMFEWIVSLGKKCLKVSTKWQKRFSFRAFLSESVDGVVAFLRDGFAYIYLIYLVINDVIPVSVFILYISAITGFSMWVSGFAKNAILLNGASMELSDFRVFLDKSKENLNKNLPHIDLSAPLCIEFKDVSFSYGDKTIFKNFNLKIDKGKKVALVGINGAGKSTMVKLILNLAEPNKGQILINGIDSKNIDLKQYFSKFSVAFQDALILAYGIDLNISMKDRNHTDQAKVDAAIETAGLAEKVNSLKKGKYTSAEKILDRDGIELSGGERQKLILARALYKNAPFLILDEPSSALDPIAEAKLYEKYHEIAKDKTSIYISHRLASTKFCDEILLLDNGEIGERGTHSELMELNGKYAHMFNVQSHYYRKDEEAAS